MDMEVIPSIDLKDGRCVRLYQGDYQRETVYSHDPLQVALAWEAQGAPRLHVVDLDGAADGKPFNLDVISSIAAELTIPVQVGGGVRHIETAQELVNVVIDRVVIGTAAVTEPELVRRLCERYGPERVVVAVDANNGQVAIKGWRESTTVDIFSLVNDMTAMGVQRILYTDISRDGTLTEPNFEANADLVRRTGLKVLASGGIASLDHVRRLSQTGVEGAIMGRALYTRDIHLPDAIAAASETSA